jgi:hypothetical protein
VQGLVEEQESGENETIELMKCGFPFHVLKMIFAIALNFGENGMELPFSSSANYLCDCAEFWREFTT